MNYIIYHVIGRKVGMTKEPNWRHRLYEEMEGAVPVYDVLEELPISVGDQHAGDREQWWRKELGYKPDTHYVVTMHALRIRGRNGGYRSIGNLTYEQLVEKSISGGRRSQELRTPEQRSAIAKKGNDSLTPEQRRDRSRKAGQTGGCVQRVKCPHCDVEGIIANMKRWHFDHCPHKPKMSTARLIRRAV